MISSFSCHHKHKQNDHKTKLLPRDTSYKIKLQNTTHGPVFFPHMLFPIFKSVKVSNIVLTNQSDSEQSLAHMHTIKSGVLLSKKFFILIFTAQLQKRNF